MTWKKLVSLVVLLITPMAGWTAPVGTSFAYQGRLTDAGSLATGSYDLTFRLFDDPTVGHQFGGTLEFSGTAVNNGNFSAELDFGAGVFNSDTRWLEIQVRPAGGGDYVTLTPRSRVLAAPVAIYATEASTVVGGFIANPSFLGTSQLLPLELLVNGGRALRLEPSLVPNIIGGATVNVVSVGSIGAVIGGGGSASFAGAPAPNSIAANFATISGGLGNSVWGDSSLIGGGLNNAILAGAELSFIGGGRANTNIGSFSVVGGGELNLAQNEYVTVGGGSGNNAYGLAATIAGGYENLAAGSFASIPGGWANAARGDYSLAAGNHADAGHTGAFVWADGGDGVFASTSENQFSVRASGGARYETAGAGLTVDGAFAATGAEKLSIVRGVVNGDGSIAQGTGFTVSSPAAGRYDVSFSRSFSGAPVVTLSAHNSPANPVLGVSIDTSVGGVTGSAFHLFVSEGSTAVSAGVAFEFIAAGTR